MKCIILCGGLGLRIRDVSEDIPKAMVKVGGKPILWHILKHYRTCRFKEFILCLGYRGDIIREWVHWLNDTNVWPDTTILSVDTGLETMTGGRLKRVSDLIDGDTFLCTYGDGLCPLDVRTVAAFHRDAAKHDNAMATFVAVHPTPRFGVVDIRKDGRVNSFEEKKQSSEWINGGFFVLNKNVLKLIPGDDCVFEKDILPSCAKNNRLFAYQWEGFWACMDTYRDYLYLNELAAKGNPPWEMA